MHTLLNTRHNSEMKNNDKPKKKACMVVGSIKTPTAFWTPIAPPISPRAITVKTNDAIATANVDVSAITELFYKYQTVSLFIWSLSLEQK